MPRMTYWHCHDEGGCTPVKTPHLEEQEELKGNGFHQMARGSMREHLRWVNRDNGGIRTVADVPTVGNVT